MGPALPTDQAPEFDDSSISRSVDVARITANVAEHLVGASCNIRTEILGALRTAQSGERSELGCEVLTQLITNYQIAQHERIPACQNTEVTWSRRCRSGSRAITG